MEKVYISGLLHDNVTCKDSESRLFSLQTTSERNRSTVFLCLQWISRNTISVVDFQQVSLYSSKLREPDNILKLLEDYCNMYTPRC